MFNGNEQQTTNPREAQFDIALQHGFAEQAAQAAAGDENGLGVLVAEELDDADHAVVDTRKFHFVSMATIRGPLPVAATLNGLLNPLCSLPTDCLGHVTAFLCDKGFVALCRSSMVFRNMLQKQGDRRKMRYALFKLICKLEKIVDTRRVLIERRNAYRQAGMTWDTIAHDVWIGRLQEESTRMMAEVDRLRLILYP